MRYDEGYEYLDLFFDEDQDRSPPQEIPEKVENKYILLVGILIVLLASALYLLFYALNGFLSH